MSPIVRADAAGGLYLVDVYGQSAPSVYVTHYYGNRAVALPDTDVYRPHVYYAERVRQGADAERWLFGGGAQLNGIGVAEVGDLTLNNEDGELDTMLPNAYDGHGFIVWYAPPGTDHSARLIIATGVNETLDVQRESVIVRTRSALALADRPIQTTRYGGTNLLPAGTDGVAGDLMGKPKPLLFGRVDNITPPLVNTAKLVYQVNDGAVQAISAVYDRGVALTGGTVDYATSALLLASTPAASGYNTCLAEGFFMLGSANAGLITCDAAQGATTAARTVGQLVAQICAKCGINVTAADVTALDLLVTNECGVWVAGEATSADVCTRLLDSTSCALYVSRDGFVRLKRFAVPSGTSVATFTEDDLKVPLERRAGITGSGVPYQRCTVRYAQNYTVQTDGDLASGFVNVSAARREYLKQQWRESTQVNNATATLHLLSGSAVLESAFADATGAGLAASYFLTLHSVARSVYELTVALDATTAVVDLNDVVTLSHPRYGLAAGVQARVIGVRASAARDEVTFTVWC